MAAKGRDGKLVANWIIGELFATLNEAGLSVANSPITAPRLGGLIDRISDQTISRRIAKEVFEIMLDSDLDADSIIEQKGLKQVSDTGEIDIIIDRILAENPEKFDELKSGKEKLVGWFVGQIMKASKGKANPKIVNDLLKNKLKD